MLDPQELARLRAFRQALYDDLGPRQDSLFELVDAVLSVPERATLVRLSLAPGFRRRWPSACDALADGGVPAPTLRRLFVGALPAPGRDGRPVWALDGTTWPRPHAATSPARTWEYRPVAGQPQKHLVPAWEYQWLVAVPEALGSWALPLDVRRRGPLAGTPTELAIQQVRAVQAVQAVQPVQPVQPAQPAQPAAAPTPVVTCDGGYAVGELARAALPADLLVRLARKRTVYRAPGAYAGRGAPRKHGAAFKVHAPTTHGPPDRTATLQDPTHGQVTVDVWADLHDPSAPHAPFTVVRVTVAHLPRGRSAHGRSAPEPLWLAWIGGALPVDLGQLWRWYQRRFTIEHSFRFLKHDLGWTTVRPRAPAAADRWTWLLAAALWQLWFARALVADARLPWERPLAPPQLPPGRVRRAFGGLLAHLGSPARAPKVRGKAPGRQPGQRPGPAPRPPVHYRRDPHDRRCRCPSHQSRRRVA